MTDRAPIHRDATRLAEWLLDRHAKQPDPASQRLCGRALDLLEVLTLALAGRDVDRSLEEADRALVVLRMYLRLEQGRDRLTPEQLIHAAGLADGVGRQLGG